MGDTKMSHLHAVIAFWILVVLTVVSWTRVLYLDLNPEELENVSQLEAQFLIISGFFVFPLIILFALIPSGYFIRKEKSIK